MPETTRARAIGFNHVALEVGEIDQALAFYDRLFELTLRERDESSAFVDLGMSPITADGRGSMQMGRRPSTHSNRLSPSGVCAMELP